MNALVDKGIIKEISNGNNFEFITDRVADFLETDYKVMQSQSDDIFIKCVKIRRNGFVDLCYLGNEYRTLEGMSTGITAETARSIASGIVSAVNKVKANGFLSCQSIVLDESKIFVEPNTMRVRLAYVPIKEKLFDTIEDFQEQLDALLCRLGADRKVIEFSGQAISDLSSVNSGNVGAGLTLVACGTAYPFEIRIFEKDVLIGKNPEVVDKVIDFNSAISRRHCRIMEQNGNYYVMDEGSANGTYVNGEAVDVGQKHLIKHGDILRLANSDFRVD